MNVDQVAFGQVAKALAKHYDSMYYVDVETDNFIEFFHSQMLNELNLPEQGVNFFDFMTEQAHRIVHPDDLGYILKLINKDSLLGKLKESSSSIAVCRFILGSEIFHICHISILCEDNKHILGCIKNIENEYQEREAQDLILQSVQRLARMDELTGIKNKNAYAERVNEIEFMIRNKDMNMEFGVVMCDINDLKQINDTMGHSFGDESIQKASRMICDIYKNSSVYRIGGDEFVVILAGDDYKKRDHLFYKLKKESETNAKLRSGPVVASGMAVFNASVDKGYYEVFERADGHMYDNKKKLKSGNYSGVILRPEIDNVTIPDGRKRTLDKLFAAMYTMAGDGYVFLTDLRYSFSRWSLSLVNDFGLQSEYMYHVEDIWARFIHPDDLDRYREVVDAVLQNNSVLYSISYRAQKADGTYVILKPRGFVLNDNDGVPEYFGGIIIPQ
ncbi:MAG: diguanylate cyclase [Eubacterium sp.]|nr:diguanylate cyclase [Eubacterium sp.]